MITSWCVGPFDELAVVEPGTGADQGDQVGALRGPPAGLSGLEELERHRDAGGTGAPALERKEPRCG